MSQVNKFKQEQNPDYIYFDLQQTNVQNTTEFIQQPLKFVETRDAPIVANSGEYHLSVTRFQLDTYNLPVLVVEPDLTQDDATYNKDQTIYKVAMLPVNCNIKSQISSITTEVVYENFVTDRQLNYGIFMDFNNGDNGLDVAIAYPQYNANRGAIIHWKEGNSKNLYTWTGAVNSFIGLFCVSITNNSRWLCASISNFPRTFLWDTESGVRTDPRKIITDDYLGPAFISPDTTKIIKMNFDNNNITLRTFIEGTVTVSANVGSGIFSTYFTGEDAILGENGIGMNFDGTNIVVSNYTYEGGGLTDAGAVSFVAINWATGVGTITPFVGASFDYFGWCVCMSANGLVAAASAKGGNPTPNPYIKIYNKVSGNWTLVQTLNGGQVELGDRLTLSNDGTFLIVATHSSRNVKRFKRTSGTFAFDKLIANFTSGRVNAACDYNGTKTVVVNYDYAGTAPAEEQYIEINAVNIGDPFDIPDSIDNVPIIAPVIWKNDYKDAVAPEKNVLTGKNTALYQYYYCNAYENFIARVNTAIRTAYIGLIERLYNDWVVITNNASLTNVFIDVIVRQFAPPPFLEWNEAELKADLYATLLFQTQYINVEETINYSSNPDITWSVVGNNRVGTPGLIAPFNFQLAMNAPLYSLFNTLPASKKVLTAPVTGYRENYYIMNFFTTGNDLITPSVPLHTVPNYPLTANYIDGSGNLAYPSQYTANIAHANLLIKQPQELSTIDTWTPISAIVFTTTSLPIVVNQYSVSSSIGEKPPSGSTSNEFAFIITDIQSNDQGFRPNVLYTPTAEFRRIDLTGNQPIRNIDISIFWRSTTGALIPMVLASGAQASIKLLFEKKDKTNQKEANASTLATSVRDIV